MVAWLDPNRSFKPAAMRAVQMAGISTSIGTGTFEET